MKLTAIDCLDRANHYEAAAEHLRVCFDTLPIDPNLHFVLNHLDREVDAWEVRAENLERTVPSAGAPT